MKTDPKVGTEGDRTKFQNKSEPFIVAGKTIIKIKQKATRGETKLKPKLGNN